MIRKLLLPAALALAAVLICSGWKGSLDSGSLGGLYLQAAPAARFTEELNEEFSYEWSVMTSHPFIVKAGANEIELETFANWLQQDYLYVQGASKFLGLLIAKAPDHLAQPLGHAVATLNKELELFEEMAADLGVGLDDLSMSPTCYHYLQFLYSIGYSESFACGFAVLYGLEKAYLDSWLVVKENLDEDVPWQEFIDQWTNEGFQGWVGFLGDELDDLAEGASDSERQRMKELYLTTIRYEYLFWDLALYGEDWPL
ncbi:hypothetical protein IIA79_02535 [bacterium]|nr:hypothetical protein [bacterium]